MYRISLKVCLRLSGRWGSIRALCCLGLEEGSVTECYPQVGLASCDDLITDPLLRALIWMVGLFCVAFNAVVGIWRLKENKVWLSKHGIIVCFIAEMKVFTV